jgi:acetylornithine deacetylase/succinyl-diaminopimelate desuccinylase-like protein
LAHTDVVEAKREDWTMDPFVFTEKDGFYYGCGTADDKAQVAFWTANLIRYKREGYKPDRDIILALTADEEGGGPTTAWHGSSRMLEGGHAHKPCRSSRPPMSIAGCRPTIPSST